MADRVLMVFTAKTKEEILQTGGTRSWVLNPQSMRGVDYVVCTRNADRQHDEECGVRPERHGSAFLVGKISGLKKVDVRNGRDRYLVQFSEYAEIDKPDVKSSARNPVTYSDTEALKLLDVDIASLTFKQMPQMPSPPAFVAEPVKTKGLSISDAKKGLAIQFGVSVEDIQITISG